MLCMMMAKGAVLDPQKPSFCWSKTNTCCRKIRILCMMIAKGAVDDPRKPSFCWSKTSTRCRNISMLCTMMAKSAVDDPWKPSFCWSKTAPAAETSANCIDHSSKMDAESDHPYPRKPSPTKIGFRLKFLTLNGSEGFRPSLYLDNFHCVTLLWPPETFILLK